jgi:hypothetical protein
MSDDVCIDPDQSRRTGFRVAASTPGERATGYRVPHHRSTDCTSIMRARAALVVPNEFAIPILTVV